MSFHTQADVLRRTLVSAVIASGAAAVMASLGSLIAFGADPTKSVSVADAMLAFIVCSAVVAGILGLTLSYNSARALQRLALIRAELWRVSRTDH